MGETLPLFEPSFNRTVKVETRAENLTSDAGAILLREALDRTGIIEWLVRRLRDPRNPKWVWHTLDELLRSALILNAHGWGDLSDIDAVHTDPVLGLSRTDRRGLWSAEKALASQPTLSRLLGTLALDGNRQGLDAAAMVLAGRRIRATNGGRRSSSRRTAPAHGNASAGCSSSSRSAPMRSSGVASTW